MMGRKKKSKKERVLTAQEEARRAGFNRLQEALANQGYQRKDLVVDSVKINVMGMIVTLPFVVVALVIYSLINGRFMQTFSNQEFYLLWIALVLGIVIHEGIHGLTWSRFCKKGWKAIEFGIIWKYLTPYCTCNECLNYKQYKIGALMPTIILGGGTYILALIMGSHAILFYSIVMIISGGGDIYITMLIRQYKEAIFIDHPWEPGCVAFEKVQSISMT